MPKVEVASLKQKAVYFPIDGHDRHGEPKLGTPIEIKCRWELGFDEETDPEGRPIAVDTKVFVDRVLEIGSKLRLGTSTTDTDLRREIVDFKEIPDIKGRSPTRIVLLKKVNQ